MRAAPLLAIATAVVTCACGERKAEAATPAPAAVVDAGYDAGAPTLETTFASAMSGHKAKRYTGDLDRIKQEGVLRVLTINDSTSYFLHRGVEAGFNYELAKVFADELGVRMEMVVPRARRDLIPWLLQGRGDIIIAGTPVDAPRTSRVKMTRPYMRTGLVVVTRKGRVPALDSLEALPNATLVVHPSSSAVKRLRQLSQDQGLKLNVSAALETVAPEDIMDDVAEGNADAAVVQKRVAAVELAHRDDLEIALELPVGIVESAFAVPPTSPKLWEAADDFLRRNYRGTVFNILYWRYHRTTKQAAEAREDELRADREGAITEWDDVFRAQAEAHDLDWRLLVAQAFQESRLDPKAKSSYGAQGLMQIMPATAKELGVKDPWDPQQSIAGGAKYMRKLIDRFDEGDEVKLKDRVRFALASYNVGPGHVDDARRLAAELGNDPNRWFDNVNQALRLLSKPRYFKNAKYGYCRGEEPFKYVSEIQTRYDAYVAVTSDQKPQ
jgi:membrane-bound lytic murein transglycosylase F